MQSDKDLDNEIQCITNSLHLWKQRVQAINSGSIGLYLYVYYAVLLISKKKCIYSFFSSNSVTTRNVNARLYYLSCVAAISGTFFDVPVFA